MDAIQRPLQNRYSMRQDRPRVLVTQCVHPQVIERLESRCAVTHNPGRDPWPPEAVLEFARGSAAIMAFMPDRIDEAFLAQCPALRIVAAALKGVDNFDVDACTRRGVWFARASDLLTVPTAELAIGLLLAVTRNLLPGDERIRGGFFRGWRPELYGAGLGGKTLGLIGLGAVGRAIVKRLSGFDLRFVYADPVRTPADFEQAYSIEQLELGDLLHTCDFVMPLAHLTAETFHLIDAQALARMKRGAYLVNVGRGSLVDEGAVAASLASGRLAGYAADVFEMEDWALASRPRAIHQALLADRERTCFTPHLGSAVDEARLAIEMEAAESILEALSGRRPRGAINEPRSALSAARL
jgi:phosphonate dehydrogenase